MRIALGIEYDGTAYHGFQAQEGLATIQGTLEAALSRVADHPVQIFCAGRTDAGVHASAQVVHFNTHAVREDFAWLQGTNTYLPDDISVNWVKPVSDEFHARFGATSRRYRYTIINTPNRSATHHRYAAWYRRPLNAAAMHQAAQQLVGTHDFSAFRAAQCQAKSPVRTIQWLKVVREGDIITLDIKADAFLQHMVRNIVGTLLPIGYGDEPINAINKALESRDRAQAGVNAKPCGLSLIEINYPEIYALPNQKTERMVHELV